LHDFSPGILPSGLFWIVKVPDSAVTISTDGETLTIHLENVPLIDAFTFPPALGNGITPFPVVAMKASFDVTYKKAAMRHRIRPTSHDPLSPLNWAGEMWDATNSGTFSMAYDDGTFSASGSFSSAGNFGEMGTERNGSFVRDEDFDNENSEAAPSSMPVAPELATREMGSGSAVLKNAPRLKGRVLLPMSQSK
jgi:hypothetical protein